MKCMLVVLCCYKSHYIMWCVYLLYCVTIDFSLWCDVNNFYVFSTCNWGWTCALSWAVTVSCVSSRCSPNWFDTRHTHRPASSGVTWRMCRTSWEGVTRIVCVTGCSCPIWSRNHLQMIKKRIMTQEEQANSHGIKRSISIIHVIHLSAA